MYSQAQILPRSEQYGTQSDKFSQKVQRKYPASRGYPDYFSPSYEWSTYEGLLYLDIVLHWNSMKGFECHSAVFPVFWLFGWITVNNLFPVRQSLSSRV